MAKIVGGTASTTMPLPDWNQTDPRKADYIKNKPFDKVDDALNADSTNPVQNKVVWNEFDGLSRAVVKKSDVDAELDGKSQNPIQNCVVTEQFIAIDNRFNNYIKPSLTALEADVAELKESGTVAIPTDYVTPQMFGAKGDGVTDDTAAIQAAMDASLNVYIPGGTYIVNGEFGIDAYAWSDTSGGIHLHSGQRVYMANDCVIKVVGNGPDGWITTGFSTAFNVYGAKNVEIHGGKIVGGTVKYYANGEYIEPEYIDTDTGEKKNRLSTACYGVWVVESENVRIDNVDVSGMRGDGIILTGLIEKKLDDHGNQVYVDGVAQGVCVSEKPNAHVTIQNCTLHDCTRQGISVVMGDNVTIANNHIYNIKGNAPESAIDLEPTDHDGNGFLHNITVDNCIVENCVQSFCFSKCYDVTIDNCVFPTGVVAVHDAYDVKFNNCKFEQRIDICENCEVDFYACDIAVTAHNAPELGKGEAVSHYYECRFSGGMINGGFSTSVVANAGVFYFKNCEFMFEVQTGNDRFIYGNMPCRFDGCTFGSIPLVADGKTTYLPRLTSGCDLEFNNCHFDVHANSQHLFLNPARLIMQNCDVKTNGHVFMYSGAVVNSQIISCGNIFDLPLNVLYIADGVTITTPSLALLNNTLVNSTRTFVRNKGTDPIAVKDINNNKI